MRRLLMSKELSAPPYLAYGYNNMEYGKIRASGGIYMKFEARRYMKFEARWKRVFLALLLACVTVFLQ